MSTRYGPERGGLDPKDMIRKPKDMSDLLGRV
jgi:hypothetical protein